MNTDNELRIESLDLLADNDSSALREEIETLALDDYFNIFVHLKNTNRMIKFDESTPQYIKLWIVNSGGVKIRSVGRDYFTIQVPGKPIVYMPFGAVSLRV